VETEVAQSEAPAEEVKITVIFPKHEADIIGAFEARVREFEQKSGVKVDLIQSDWDSIADRVIPEMATGGSAYDVVEFDNGWVAEWCGAGWTTPLDDFMTAGYTDELITLSHLCSDFSFLTLWLRCSYGLPDQLDAYDPGCVLYPSCLASDRRVLK